jgi:hypothetical protein
MKRNRFWIGALSICFLVAIAARPALALWLQCSVTTSGVYDSHLFTITVKDAEAFREFKVTIAPRPKAVSPFLTAQLGLIAEDKWVAVVPVSEKREKGTVTYTFRVAPGALAQSYFEIHASAYAPATSDRSPFGTAMLGTEKVEQVMGGTIFELKLKDFTKEVAGARAPVGQTRSDP